MNFDLKIVGLLEFRTIARRPTDPDPFKFEKKIGKELHFMIEPFESLKI